MRLNIKGLSVRPTSNSKTSRALRVLLDAIGPAIQGDCDLLELADVSGDLRAVAYRAEAKDQAFEFIRDIETCDALFLGLSMKAPSGYPSLLRHLFEMADPLLLLGKPAVVLKTHCNGQDRSLREQEADLFLKAFGIKVVADVRLSSAETLRGIVADDQRISEAGRVLQRTLSDLQPSARGGPNRRILSLPTRRSA